MKGKLVYNRSGYLVVWPVIAGLFICCILSFIFRSYALSFVLLLVFLVMLTARLWSAQCIKKLQFSVRASGTGVFPGEQIVFHIEVKNDKFLPVMCAEAYFPLAKNLCLLPEHVRDTQDSEKAYLEDFYVSVEKIGEQSIPSLLWYETQNVKSVWTASRRGVYSTNAWKLRAGDGFGISQMELEAGRENTLEIAVYPEKIPVRTSMFMRMAWSADTGARGVMEDHTVIRSTRDYRAGDPVKRINWRITAKGRPLTVNIYEEVLPQSVLFLFDGESFSGKEKHPEAMEDALSILGSVMMELEGSVRCGLGLPEDRQGRRCSIPIGADPEEFLRALAGYEPKEDLRDEEQRLVDRIPVFDVAFVDEEEQRTGRFYYLVYDAERMRGNAVLSVLDPAKTTILSYTGEGRFRDFPVESLTALKAAQPEQKATGPNNPEQNEPEQEAPAGSGGGNDEP